MGSVDRVISAKLTWKQQGKNNSYFTIITFKNILDFTAISGRFSACKFHHGTLKRQAESKE